VSELPSGTVTFLFTDIEGSTALLRQLGSDYGEVLEEHQRILREAFAAHGGHEVDTQGDSFFVAFGRAKDAVAAATDAQRDLAAHQWPEGTELRVRMGLHTGEPQVGEQRYVGIGVHKAARIGAAGHGGQVLLSSTTRELAEDELPQGVTIRDVGERRLKDLERPERLFQLVIEGLRSDFDPLKTLDVELARKRRRMYAGAALIGVLAAAVAIPVFALGQGHDGSASAAPNSVAVISPDSNRVVGSISNVGVRPSPIAVGAGAVWVGNLDDRTLARVDPATRAIERVVPLGRTPTGIAVGSGAVWVANGQLGTVSRVESDDVNAPVKVIPVTGRTTTGSVAFREGSVWAAFGDSTIARIDPVSNRRVALGYASVFPTAVAVGDGWVWVANAGDNTVSQINPRTTSSVRSFSVGNRPRAVTVGARVVWVANESDDSVSGIDIASGSLRTIVLPRGSRPVGIAFGEGSVWVANGGSGTVSRIDPGTYEIVKTIHVGNRPAGIALGEGAVWVTVQTPTG
jgi:YVTN family beta-propeller protein